MIRVNIAETREAANFFRTKAGEIEQSKARLNSELQGLYADWEGMSEQTFMQDYQQAEQIMVQTKTVLEEIAKALDTIANNFEAADTAH